MAFSATLGAGPRRTLKVLVFGAALFPSGWLAAGAFGAGGADLGANPVEMLIHETGLWVLRFLLLTLAITPLRRLTGMAWLLRFRRMLGLFAFYYASLHFLCYALVDKRLDLPIIVEDVLERPFITLGMIALLLLIPLAATSTKGMMRRLGRRWGRLHRLVYAVAVLGVWHFWWQVKADTLEPAVYAVILAVLLGFRLVDRRRSLIPDPSPAGTRAAAYAARGAR